MLPAVRDWAPAPPPRADRIQSGHSSFSQNHSLQPLEDHLQNLYAPLTVQNQNISSPGDTAASPHPPTLQLGITWRPNMNPIIEISQLELNSTNGTHF